MLFKAKKNKNTQSCASPLTRYFACKWFILNHKRYNTGPNSVQQYISVSVCAALCYLDHVQPLAEEKKNLITSMLPGFCCCTRLIMKWNTSHQLADLRSTCGRELISKRVSFIDHRTGSAQNYIFDLLICYEPAKPPTEKQHSSCELHIYETLTHFSRGLKFLLSLVLYLFKSLPFL